MSRYQAIGTGDDWAVIDTGQRPCEENYYGVVAFGFESAAAARAYARLEDLLGGDYAHVMPHGEEEA